MSLEDAGLSHEDGADLIALDKEHVWHHLVQHAGFDSADPFVVVEGHGMTVTDAKGKEYLDSTSGGVWSVNVGYGRESIAKAVYDAIRKMCYYAGSGGTEPGARFAERLVDVMPGLSRVYYSNSGSEANEKAYKLVRQLAHLDGNNKKTILYRDRDYHGTTIGALSSSGHDQRRDQYGPFVEGFAPVAHCCCYRCPFGKTYGSCEIECAKDVERAIIEHGPENVGSIVLEPVTAGGGIIVPPPEYFPMVQEICRKYDVKIHIDEVVCGFGRTGKWFGYQHFGVEPDFVTMAKGVASGYAAISCTVTTEAVFNRFKANPGDPLAYFRDISTFGGCTAGPAAGIENMRILKDEDLIANAAAMGLYLQDKLKGLAQKHSVIGDVRGLGLIAGFELVSDRDSKEPVHESYVARLQTHCSANGVLVGRANRSFKNLNNAIYLTPALIAGRSEIDDITAALDKALEEVPLG